MAITVLPSSPLTFTRADRSGLRIALLSRVLGTGHLSTPAWTRLPSLDAPAGPGFANAVPSARWISFAICSVTVGRQMVSSVSLRRLTKRRGTPGPGSEAGRRACPRHSTSPSWPSFCVTSLSASAPASNARTWLSRRYGQGAASRLRRMSRLRIMMEEPQAFRPTRWDHVRHAGDGVPMGRPGGGELGLVEGFRGYRRGV